MTNTPPPTGQPGDQQAPGDPQPRALGTGPVPPPGDHGPNDKGTGYPGPRVSSQQALDLGRLRRSTGDRHIAGVAGGLARHLDIDPIIVRVALVVLVFFGGAGLLIYAAVWVLVPEDTSTSQPFGLDERNRGIALVIAGVLALLAVVGDWSGAYWVPWPLLIVALVVLWLTTRSRKPRELTSGYGAPGAAAAPPAGTTSSAPTSTHPVAQPTWPTESGTESGTAWSGQAPPSGWTTATPYAPPPNPRKRGPVLFWMTLALIALGVGVLGVVDLAGVHVVSAAYPALALAITGAMLVLGAFWGRAGGLILLGLIAAVSTGIAAAADNWETQSIRLAPTSASQVQDTYNYSFGDNADRFVLDLTRLSDPEDLAGESIRIDAGVGTVEVIVPEDLAVDASADVGVGEATVFGRTTSGLDLAADGSASGDDDAAP